MKKTKLEEIFSLFYGEDEFKPEMAKPFILEDYTYATNGKSLVVCKTEYIDFDYENPHGSIKNAAKVIPNENTREIIDIDSIDFDYFRIHPEMVYSGKDIECGACDGFGTLHDTYYYNNKPYDYQFECPICDGSGFEVKAQKVPSGNLTFKEYDKILFKNIPFDAELFYVLKKVKDLMNQDVFLISINNENKAVVFEIGFLKIVIMPLVSYDEEDVIIKID